MRLRTEMDAYRWERVVGSERSIVLCDRDRWWCVRGHVILYPSRKTSVHVRATLPIPCRAQTAFVVSQQKQKSKNVGGIELPSTQPTVQRTTLCTKNSLNPSTSPVLLEDALAASAVRAAATLSPCVAIASHFSHKVARWPACAGKLGFTRARRAESCRARVGRSPSVMCAATTVHRVREHQDPRKLAT